MTGWRRRAAVTAAIARPCRGGRCRRRAVCAADTGREGRAILSPSARLARSPDHRRHGQAGRLGLIFRCVNWHCEFAVSDCSLGEGASPQAHHGQWPSLWAWYGFHPEAQVRLANSGRVSGCKSAYSQDRGRRGRPGPSTSRPVPQDPRVASVSAAVSSADVRLRWRGVTFTARNQVPAARHSVDAELPCSGGGSPPVTQSPQVIASGRWCPMGRSLVPSGAVGGTRPAACTAERGLAAAQASTTISWQRW